MTRLAEPPTLSDVPSTLRIPLAARAFGDAMFPRVAVGDAHARRLLAAIGDDGTQWLDDRSTIYGILGRTRCFRDQAAAFLQRQPTGHVVNLGCGLSHYFQWLDNGQSRMTDADLPEVLAIRRRLLPPRNRRHVLRELDLTAPDWWDALALPADRDDGEPVFLFCEGVLMYLQPAAVEAVLRTFGERAAPGSRLAFDAMCWLAIGQARMNRSVRRTAAEFRWGVRRVADLAAAHPRLRLASTHAVMENYDLPYSVMGPLFRALMGVPLYGVYVMEAAGGGR